MGNMDTDAVKRCCLLVESVGCVSRSGYWGRVIPDGSVGA